MKLRFEIMLTMKQARCRSWMAWSSFSDKPWCQAVS